MGALGIRHVINIIGYVRDIPDSAYFTSWQLCIVTNHPTVLLSSYFTDQEDV